MCSSTSICATNYLGNAERSAAVGSCSRQSAVSGDCLLLPTADCCRSRYRHIELPLIRGAAGIGDLHGNRPSPILATSRSPGKQPGIKVQGGALGRLANENELQRIVVRIEGIDMKLKQAAHGALAIGKEINERRLIRNGDCARLLAGVAAAIACPDGDLHRARLVKRWSPRKLTGLSIDHSRTTDEGKGEGIPINIDGSGRKRK